ncbi:MAG: TRM11 family methyltransferase [Candidatus Bathyarchaeia archaeon]
MAKLFFLLSGENETLPAAELKAILISENFPFRFTEQLDQAVRLEADIRCVQPIHRRAAYTMASALELFACRAEEDTIVKAVDNMDFDEAISAGESFAVRIKRVKEHTPQVSSTLLEAKLGRQIFGKVPEAKINLSVPDKTFFGVLTSGKLLFGVKLAEITPKTFSERRPRKKPFFHPSAMPSKLARCMVNLAHAKAGKLLLDPFCGTGSILIEAALISCRVLGFDVQRRMARGCLKNLDFFNISPEGIVVADARKPPLLRIDCIATDPPYGRSATTLKSTTKNIVKDVLSSARLLLQRGQRICIASPKTLNIAQVGLDLGYRHVESHFAYVHRTLTREIAVFEA